MAVGRKKKSGARSGKAPRDTREHLLDHAEALFAQRGFYGVSVRDITQAAGVDVSMINYHFGSKQELIAAVFDRRAQSVNADRLEQLEEARRRFWPLPPTPEALLEAYVTPLTRRLKENNPGWRHYFALVAEVNNSPEWSSLMTQHFDPFIRQFVAAMQEALPGCSARDLHWANHFFSGAITLSLAQTGRVERLSEGQCDSTQIDELYERLLTLFSAGFRALAATSSPTAEPTPAGPQRPPRLPRATPTPAEAKPAPKKTRR
ncbi:TetR/AcrR family transcriptional regulator [Steroidobacter flavus]|uniref:TetR/AcrR family transcriptional regulator n=1 Tax=Steroidobacter flavus TaxID=1842136 RepID=A0ABV8SY48_9GAMM